MWSPKKLQGPRYLLAGRLFAWLLRGGHHLSEPLGGQCEGVGCVGGHLGACVMSDACRMGPQVFGVGSDPGWCAFVFPVDVP